MSEALRRRIMDEIHATGPMSFARYMELALYDPLDGFFAGLPVGTRGHFLTSPHVSPVFGMCLAVHVHETWEALGSPDGFTVVELGAGDGTLAAGILEALPAPMRERVHYVAVEQGDRARAACERRGIEAVSALAEAAPEPIDGVVLANELLDNLPFRRVRRSNGRILEVFVAVEDDRLVEVLAAPAAPADPEPAEGQERTVSSAGVAVVRDVAARLRRGTALFIDYGSAGGSFTEPVRGYRDHALELDLLADPGGSDITGPVDFNAIAAAGRRAGLTVWGPVSQRDALRALGFAHVVEELRGRQRLLERAGCWRDAVLTMSARTDAATLVEPHGLGSLLFLAMGTIGMPEPTATAGARA